MGIRRVKPTSPATATCSFLTNEENPKNAPEKEPPPSKGNGRTAQRLRQHSTCANRGAGSSASSVTWTFFPAREDRDPRPKFRGSSTNPNRSPACAAPLPNGPLTAREKRTSSPRWGSIGDFIMSGPQPHPALNALPIRNIPLVTLVAQRGAASPARAHSVPERPDAGPLLAKTATHSNISLPSCEVRQGQDRLHGPIAMWQPGSH